ncbi:uncharacterized protein LOC128199737 [Bicyclus anynana]|uniref:Uncharacterized protein LOC128199737 n=1 Tax=Bicyclus anynana TaxID=110368 RepID=A0ABM3M708_BICAN|nr:uncharacterized protein LOC128199737 [Bicyclus anynana]
MENTSEVCVSAFFDSVENEMCEISENYEKLNEDCVSIFFNSSNDSELTEIMENCLLDSTYDKELYELCENFENTTIPMEQAIQTGGALKRSSDSETSIASKRVKYADATSSSSVENSTISHEQIEGNKIRCDLCQIYINKRYFSSHLKSNLHKNNHLKSHPSLSNVSIIDSAFGQRIMSYKIDSKTNNPLELPFKTSESFINSIKNDILLLIQESITEHTVVKVNFILHAEFVQQTKEITNSFDFQSSNYILFLGDDLNIFVSSLCDTFKAKISSFERKDSGWSLTNIKCLHMNVNKFNPLRGTSYIDLPQDIKAKKAIINVKNVDHMCFKWALLSALYPPPNNKTDRVSSYSMHSDKLKFHGVSFPVKLTDIYKVENQNNISINVFGLEFNKKEKSHSIIGPLYFTKSYKKSHVNLLLISNKTNSHYCYIKNMSRLLSKQISNQEHAIYICDGCLIHFPTQERLDNHRKNDCSCVVTNIPNGDPTKKNWFGQPSSNSIIKFDKFNKKLNIPFVVYADFEAFLKPINSCSNDPTKPFTENIQKHEVYSFGYYIKCSYDDSLSKYETYCGPDCTKVFMQRLYEDIKIICRKNSFQKCPNPLTSQDENKIVNSSKCHICERSLNNEDILDFDWHTGNFRGVAHETCVAKYRAPRHIPVFLHNLSNYDAHFIVHALNFAEGEVELLPQNKERYISFSKKLNVNNGQVSLRFIDSFKFLPCSLEQLAKNLNIHQFESLKSNFPHNEDFIRLRKKGVYPYEYMTSFDSLKLTSLPSQPQFYSSLTNSNISDDDYNHAKDVWDHFQCQNMLEYSNLYLKTDVLLLTDVFENFRKLCLKTYDLDPAHYYTAPGLSWDAMLKYTEIELELLTDYDQIAFIESGIRGGISQCSNRHAKANNKFMEDYDKDKPDSYLTYLDANNLYGWAMSQYLPTGGFEWVSTETNFNVSDTSELGFILEVDLEYPNILHDLHSDLPLCAENVLIGNSNEIKLVPNLNNKIKYKILYRNLKQCISLGVKLTKIHRILKFNQSPWLQRYIDLNTNLRTLAKSDFEKDFFKLMNNSVFGKTMENIEKRVNVKMLTHWENRGKALGAQDFISKPEFHSLSVFNENLVAIQLKRTKLMYDKPIYLGFCILDISKTLMYEFHYNYMLKKFKNNVKLLYSDTDSFIYQIFTKNFYEDIKSDLINYFDTSDYPHDNVYGYPKINKKKLGLFKDENNGKILREFVGLRSKMYALDVDHKTFAKAKGVNKSVTKNMTMENYRSCLFENKIQYCTMLRFRSIKHIIFTQNINKTCLSYNDTKRHILENNIDTLAWGHYKIKKD